MINIYLTELPLLSYCKLLKMKGDKTYKSIQQ